MGNSYVDVWNNLHKKFVQNNGSKYDNWLDEFESIIMNDETEIIDLGCGVTGNVTLYLLEKGKKVISCDFAEEALNAIKMIKDSKTLKFDMLDEFPFEDNSTNLIIADLSLHYFREKDTIRIISRIISEIKRILRPNGYLLFRLNSTNSTEYKEIIENSEKEIEPHLFFYQNMEKRFFDRNDINKFFRDFKIICMREENMTRWCSDKIIWKCAVQNIK